MERVELKNLKSGDRFWECGAQGNVECEALADAEIEGDTVRCEVKILHSGERRLFGERLGPAYSGYGLNLYTAPAYAGVPTLHAPVVITEGLRLALIRRLALHESNVFKSGRKADDKASSALVAFEAKMSAIEWQIRIDELQEIARLLGIDLSLGAEFDELV
jgi:hypothetical protein